MPNELLSVRLPVNSFTLEDVDKKASELGLTRSELVIKAVDMMLNFDKVFIEKAQHYSKGLHIPEWLVIQNMAIKRMVELDTHRKVWNAGNLLPEFVFIDDKTVTGSELIKRLENQTFQEEEKKKVEALLRREYYGVPISNEDKALLIKHRAGKAWLESEEYKKEMEIQAEIERFMNENNIGVEIILDGDKGEINNDSKGET